MSLPTTESSTTRMRVSWFRTESFSVLAAAARYLFFCFGKDVTLFVHPSFSFNQVDVKASTLKDHLDSQKHKAGKEAAAKQVIKQRTITVSFKTFLETSQASQSQLPSGSSLDDVIAFRVEVLTAFLASGTPLNRLEYFRPILERAGKSLTGRTHLGSFLLVTAMKDLFLTSKKML